MVFSSFHFLFYFLPALLLLYFLLPKQLRAGRNLLLLAFSLFFYAYGGVRFLPLMLASIGINYVFGLLCAPGARGRKAMGASFRGSCRPRRWPRPGPDRHWPVGERRYAKHRAPPPEKPGTGRGA